MILYIYIYVYIISRCYYYFYYYYYCDTSGVCILEKGRNKKINNKNNNSVYKK